MNLPQKDIFNDHRAFDAFKKIRNRLRKHFPAEIVIECIKTLNENSLDTHKQIDNIRRYPPWFLFLLIKWTIKYGEYSSPNRRKLSKNDFIYLINLMHDFFGVQRGPIDFGGFYMFFRTISYQQLWLQEKYTINKLGRQHRLFSTLPSGHYLKKTFFNETNISIDDFIELSFMLISRFITSNELHINSKWFDSIKSAYPIGTIDSFLELFSKEWNDLKVYLEELPKISVAYEFHEQTPLLKYPLLKIEDKYFCFSRDLISYAVHDIIYDVVRRRNTAKFMDKFGEIFERYLEKALRLTKSKIITERELKQVLNPNEKLVDFVIVEEESNIFIDAKGIEFNKMGMVSHQKDVISDKARNSIIKGLEQYFSSLTQCLDDSFISVSKKRNFLIIITYKDLYLGNGRDFFSEIAKERYDQIQKKISQL